MIGSRAHFRRQYGVAGCTPRTALLASIPTPTARQWLGYFAAVGTDYEFVFALVRLVMCSYGNRAKKLITAARPLNRLYLTLRKFFC